MRAVVDTDVLLSGLLWHGTPHRLIEQVKVGHLALISSPALIAEFGRVVARPKFRATLARSNTNAERMLADIRRLAKMIEPPALPVPFSRDRDDDHVLALAEAAQPNLIISGDRDLLVLGSHAGIPIVTPAIALATITQAAIKG